MRKIDIHTSYYFSIVKDSDKDEYLGIILKTKKLCYNSIRHQDSSPHANAVNRLSFRADTENAMRYINGTRLDDRIIRTDFDAGFIEGRQYGRGKSGGQVSDVIYFKDYNIRFLVCSPTPPIKLSGKIPLSPGWSRQKFSVLSIH